MSLSILLIKLLIYTLFYQTEKQTGESNFITANKKKYMISASTFRFCVSSRLLRGLLLSLLLPYLPCLLSSPPKCCSDSAPWSGTSSFSSLAVTLFSAAIL